jgi:hypothetical protein
MSTSYPELITVVALALTAVSAAASSLFSYKLGKDYKHRIDLAGRSAEHADAQAQQLDHQRRTFQVRMLLRLSEEWNRVLSLRYELFDELKSANLTTQSDVESKYTDWKLFLNSNEWKKIREVINFYEFLGILLEKQYVEEDEAFVLVSVDHFPRKLGTGQRVSAHEGEFYRLVKPYIAFLRDNYREDIYLYYDHVALTRYHAKVLRFDQERLSRS